MRKLVIATRRSRLALWQAEHIATRLKKAHAGLSVELLPLSTRGDELVDQRLDKAGGKGLFIKELEQAMADGRADLAVHSMKDLPAELPAGFTLAAITAREDPLDAFVSNKYRNLGEMRKGGSVGTSSLRRSAQIAERYPQLEAKLLRGNVETRLAKLDRGEYDAIILAVAGLVRLGLASRITSRLQPDESLPAPGQGALGIECMAGRSEVIERLAFLNDEKASACVQAERAVSKGLGGNCSLPLAAYAEERKGILTLRALVASADGKRVLRAQAEGRDPAALGEKVVRELRQRGAAEILGL